jgi:hypothetical protein
MTHAVNPKIVPNPKLLAVGLMFLRRVGLVTLILALSARYRAKGYVYPRRQHSGKMRR